MTITPINSAEAIFEPFWDPHLSGLSNWQVKDGHAQGLQVKQNWCWVQFEWARKPVDGPALSMNRHFDLDCRGYDHLIISIVAPEKSIFHAVIGTERGIVRFDSPPTHLPNKEYSIDLQGAEHIVTITLEIDAAANGIASGWINWIGLQNTLLLPRYLAQWKRFDQIWEGYLKPESYTPSFEPALGILINNEELIELRLEHDAHLKEYKSSPYIEAAAEAQKLVPEQMINEYVNFWGDTRYCRERDFGNLLITRGPSAAIAGLLRKDKHLLRLAARYAMSIAMCEHWDDGMICKFPGSDFDHRCFVQSLCTHEVAMILDLAGEMFTEQGRLFLLRRIAEEGLGNINYIIWKHDYMFAMNQLTWFMPGRMLGCLVLERYFQHVRPYTEIALQDLLESLEQIVLPDGGYVEGPSYFQCVPRDGGLPLYYYARARGKPFAEMIPPAIKRTALFADALTSTTLENDVIPICDGSPSFQQEAAAVLAVALPESQWVNLYQKVIHRQGMSNNLLTWQLTRRIKAHPQARKPFIFLPEMGVMSSTRKLNGEELKLFIMGNRAGAGHTHEDKGSFVLEFAGDSFAIDPGTCDYSNPLSEMLQFCERHNMLVPTGTEERAHPQCPLPVDVKPLGEGDERRFHATIDATPGWEGYYQRWVRTWDSPSPDTLTISDEYALESGDGVEFYWNTRLPVQVTGNQATISGRHGNAILTFPLDCSLRVDELPLLDGPVQRRIAACKTGKAGQLIVTIRFSAVQD